MQSKKMMVVLLAALALVALAVAEEGTPEQGPKSCICPRILQPVCGSDRETYSNGCELRCAAKQKKGLRLLHEGSCKK